MWLNYYRDSITKIRTKISFKEEAWYDTLSKENIGRDEEGHLIKIPYIHTLPKNKFADWVQRLYCLNVEYNDWILPERQVAAIMEFYSVDIVKAL